MLAATVYALLGHAIPQHLQSFMKENLALHQVAVVGCRDSTCNGVPSAVGDAKLPMQCMLRLVIALELWKCVTYTWIAWNNTNVSPISKQRIHQCRTECLKSTLT